MEKLDFENKKIRPAILKIFWITKIAIIYKFPPSQKQNSVLIFQTF